MTTSEAAKPAPAAAGHRLQDDRLGGAIASANLPRQLNPQQLAVPVLGVDRTVEVKVRSNGFRQLYHWLERPHLLIIRGDWREPLLVLPLRLAAEIAAAAERGK